MHEIFYLKNDYIIDVRVCDGNSNYSGKLTLTPKECFIEIFTERTPSEEFKLSESLICSSLYPQKTLLLFGTELVSFSSTLLEMQNIDPIWGTSFKFKIQYVIISYNYIENTKKINNFTLNTNFLKKWTMHTKTQDKILNGLFKRDSSRETTGKEFFQEIQNYGYIGLYYSSKEFSSIDELNAGLKIFPHLRTMFTNSIPMDEIYREYLKLYQLLALFNGGDFKVDTVELEIDEWRSKPSYMYFPSFQNDELHSYTLLPLGKDVIYSDQRLATLPLNFFNAYYNLTDEKKEIFKRYLNYKRVHSTEEKFLGYFRLLEKLTFKTKSYVDSDKLSKLLKWAKSYLTKKLDSNSKTMSDLNKRILHTNNSKYNTEKCIADFYDTLPQEIQNSLQFKKDDLRKICKLRNDITHANDYVISDYELYDYTTFINALLFLAITNLLLEIPLETCIPISRRLKQS
ncbi:hypothetical protein B7L44_10320 [Acinetobacter nosocomialis]|uniref:HEPN domain-containing protein n=1 Tax=Acinetobacter nosocomialis TaxID=106654 RepID=UPI0009E10A20|nr:HEPN domain-containing protein [Acinetobacter nosocomialis]ARG16951.1 hypothetical protein B7L44_10320 [Acinetobacter nosocomialis]